MNSTSFYGSCRNLDASRGADEFWGLPDPLTAITLRPCVSDAQWFVVSRDSVLADFFRSSGIYPSGYPDHAGYAETGRLATRQVARVLWTEAHANTLPLRYVCGLDPYDLACYYSFLEGGVGDDIPSCHDLAPPEITYSGISDPWLAMIDALATCAKPRLVKMSEMDRRGWAMLRSLNVEWEQVIGPQAASLLDDGWTLTLYSALPERGPREYAEAVRNLVFPPRVSP